MVNPKKRIVMKANDTTTHKNSQLDRPSTVSTFLPTRPSQPSMFERRRMLKEQKELAVKQKYFEMYKLKPDPNEVNSTMGEQSKLEEKKVDEFAPIINGLIQLQQHAKKVNHIKQYQAEVLDTSGALNRSITLLDSKIQKITTSPDRTVTVNPEDLEKSGRSGVTKNQATWLRKRGYQ